MAARNSEEAAIVRRDAEEVADAFPPLLTEAERLARSVAAGLHGRRRAGPGETFWQHRPYAFGDAVSAIDWRQSARVADRLYVRQNEWEAAAAIWIWRDPSRSMDFSSLPATPTKRRRADILALALAILLSQAGERVGLAGAGMQPFHGRNAPARILEALNVERFDDAASAPPRSPPRAGSRVVFISDFFTRFEEIEASAMRFAAALSSGAMLQIVDEAEAAFPYRGRVEFSDPETSERITFGDTTRIADDYRRAFADHQIRLETLCRRIGWTFITHRTGAPASAALLSLYEALAGDDR